MAATLWASSALDDWRAARDRYDAVVAAQGVSRLTELDRWYRHELPEAFKSRERAYVTHLELAQLTEWKMARGVWRAPNLALVRSNEPATVVKTSALALAKTPDPLAPIRELVALKGVGPATASAVVSAFAPDTYPFFDELVAQQVPELGAVEWTIPYYARYAEAIRSRARVIGEEFTPVMVEQALWSHVGGKKGTK